MDYLSSNNIVHRDIATRNCVVCSGDMVKISDAAFSWSLFPDEYMYDSDRERWLPVRWMAQDSLQSGFYSTTTDVWSYGVLMWEVMSRGVLLPYFDIENNEDIKDHVINGYRLGKPDTVPDEMYILMMSCWDTNHSQRPAFVRIIERLIDILNPQEPSHRMYQNQEELPEYGNLTNDPPKLPSRANMPANNGNVNFGFR
ncbi:tyrosine-protein kinase RYK-like [Pecten maximus]|uniref:tyrosine-protein kinase RYK-like n=1 Tax=Pecten maximus TaxID=6579 RepID=UPI001458A5B3|nr:tyrosine-protein kinase RYK-like [Pecten maximus]